MTEGKIGTNRLPRAGKVEDGVEVLETAAQAHGDAFWRQSTPAPYPPIAASARPVTDYDVYFMNLSVW